VIFNSHDFLLGFLPAILALVSVAWRLGGPRAVRLTLFLGSLVFYGWYHPPYLVLLLGSIGTNLALGRQLMRADLATTTRRRWLQLGVMGNVLLLGAFKYEVFVRDNVAALTGWTPPIPDVTLPLAISFFTFQQIAYLVDASRQQVERHTPLAYALFVSFFPQLIAGPIVHHDELLPQLRRLPRPTWTDAYAGLAMMSMGLAKKVLLADPLAPYAEQVFGAASLAHLPTVADAWTGTLAFFFQVYFDFSGYSDIAIGLARLFGIKLPANFDAPYRCTDINEFWRRWHMTLSRFLFAYVYVPLGGGRVAPLRRDVNLMATMVVAGVWHGAGWNYAAFGVANGAMMVVQRHWRAWRGRPPRGRMERTAAHLLTMVGVNYGYVFFRSSGFDNAFAMHLGCVGLTDAGLGTLQTWPTVLLTTCVLVTQFMPTSQRLLTHFEPVLSGGFADTLRWPDHWTIRATTPWAVALGLLFAACIPMVERADAFIYWAF